jgi:hypothetical protein
MRTVSPHAQPTTAELTALRVRLYRPDPPVGAVDAYLDALRATVPAAAVPPVRPVGPPVRRGRAGGALAAVGALVTVALGLAVAIASTGPAVADAPPPAAAHLELPPLSGTPIGTLYGGAGTTALLDGRGATVVVSVNCSGSGTLTVRIDDDAPVVLACEAGGPALAMLSSTTTLHRFTITVARDGPVQWSLTAGALRLLPA